MIRRAIASLLLLVFAAALVSICASRPAASQVHDPISGVTTIAADTGGYFANTPFSRDERLRASVRTTRLPILAPNDPSCIYGQSNPRVHAVTSSTIRIFSGKTLLFTWTLLPSELITGPWTKVLPSRARFIVLWVEAPLSPCGVNSGQVTFEWILENAPVLKDID